MADQEKVQELLERGLYHYGLGEVGKALQLWHEVLALDPRNELAREYIKIETGPAAGQAAPVIDEDVFDLDSEVAEESEAGLGPAQPGSEEFFAGQQFLLSERWLEAEQAFLAAHQRNPTNPFDSGLDLPNRPAPGPRGRSGRGLNETQEALAKFQDQVCFVRSSGKKNYPRKNTMGRHTDSFFPCRSRKPCLKYEILNTKYGSKSATFFHI